MTRLMPETDRLPYALYRAAQVRELDRLAIEQGTTGRVLMELAGTCAFDELMARWPNARRIGVLCGVGNNAGDGYVVARLALESGMDVCVCQLGENLHFSDEARAMVSAFHILGGKVVRWDGRLPRCDVIVDGLFGTGLARPLEGAWAEVVNAANVSRAPVLALDIPSGVHADTGRVLGAAIRADLTVSFIGLKQGMFTADGPEHCGDLRFSPLGVPAVIYSGEILAARRVDWQRLGPQLPIRPRGAHKGDFGHVLIIGGGPGTSGAVRLAGEAALRCGAGLVTLATHPQHAAVLNLTRAELMVRAVAEPMDLVPLLQRADQVVLGPGLGGDDWAQGLFAAALGSGVPLVIDADGLNLLAAAPRRSASWVLTPHPGEAARLLGTDAQSVEEDRFEAVRALQERYGGTCVLKGAGTLVSGPGHRPPAVCSDGNPGMATAGSGDVLAGMLGALLAAGGTLSLEVDEAVELGVCLHAAAGDRAARELGEMSMIAGDIIEALPSLTRALA